MKLLLSEPAPQHRVGVLIYAVADVLAAFQEKSLNPIYVLTRTLLSPMDLLLPCF